MKYSGPWKANLQARREEYERQPVLTPDDRWHYNVIVGFDAYMATSPSPWAGNRGGQSLGHAFQLRDQGDRTAVLRAVKRMAPNSMGYDVLSRAGEFPYLWEIPLAAGLPA